MKTFFLTLLCCQAAAVIAGERSGTLPGEWKTVKQNGAEATYYSSGDSSFTNVWSYNAAAKELVILDLSLLPVGKPVEIRADFQQTGNYSLVAGKNLKLAPGSCLVIEDLLTNDRFDLASSAVYPFKVKTPGFGARFAVMLTKPVTTSYVAPRCSYSENGKAVIKADLPGKWSYTWKDALGNVLTVHPEGEKTDTLHNLAPGVYHVMASGKNKTCSTITDSIVVKSTPPMIAHSLIKHNVYANEKNGGINARNIRGGAGPFRYKWSNGDSTAIIRNLAAGVYILYLSDSRGCRDTVVHTVKKAIDPLVSLPAGTTQKQLSGDGQNELKVSTGTEVAAGNRRKEDYK